MRTHAGITHPGIRPVNEDCFGIFPVGKAAYLYAVCDGVGGCAGGQTASSLALSSFSNFILSELDSSSVADPDALPLAQIKRIMRAAASHASHTVRTAGLNDPTLTDMASTLVAALVTATRAYVLHVGDSRLYTVTSDTVEKVTRDHSYLQYLIDVGRVTPRQAKELKIENYITQAIGVYDYVDGDFCAWDPTAHYSLMTAKKDGTLIAVSYMDRPLEIGEAHQAVVFFNATSKERLTLRFEILEASYACRIYDCEGELISEEIRTFSKGIYDLDVPDGGRVEMTKI